MARRRDFLALTQQTVPEGLRAAGLWKACSVSVCPVRAQRRARIYKTRVASQGESRTVNAMLGKWLPQTCITLALLTVAGALTTTASAQSSSDTTVPRGVVPSTRVTKARGDEPVLTVPDAEHLGGKLEDIKTYAETESIAVEEYLHNAAERDQQRKQIKTLTKDLENLHTQLVAARVRLGEWSATEYARLDDSRLGSVLLRTTDETEGARQVYIDAAVGRDVAIVDELRVLETKYGTLLWGLRQASARLDALDVALTAAKEAALRAAHLDSYSGIKLDSKLVEAAIDFPRGTPEYVKTAVRSAITQIGVPYVFAGDTPGKHFDCSGLTMWAYSTAGVSLTHSSRYQMSQTQRVTRKKLRTGDLVFYGSPVHHVALYLGNNIVIEAPATGFKVQYSSIDDWKGPQNYGRVIAD